MIHVSTDQGEEWNMAQLPPVGHEQFYSILAANDEMVFMHVDEPGGEQALCIITYYMTMLSFLLQYSIINTFSDSNIKFFHDVYRND